MQSSQDHSESIAEALEHMHPELAPIRQAGGVPVYLVGGAVRDLLLGRGRADIDLVVEGDAAALAELLGAEVTSHERFGTAKVKLDGHELDIAGARSETYPQPGALPVVEAGADLAADLRRRDFTINAMAIPLWGDARLIDPHGGEADLATRQLRILHDGSFVDDPTRALRAARYASRFGFGLEERTAELIRKTDLTTVSADRREGELRRLAAEENAPEGFALLAEWGLLALREGGVELVKEAAELLGGDLWRGVAPRDRVLLAAALGPARGEVALAAAEPQLPSQAVALAAPHDSVELLLARALGAEWLDRYVGEWRDVALEIDGSDLIGAGLSQGPALGRGLEEALRRKLDGEVSGREQELAAALEAARSSDGVA
ncbi:MAG: CCA tRNA nucleotidyltransferase [Thermoleophilia bacterium]